MRLFIQYNACFCWIFWQEQSKHDPFVVSICSLSVFPLFFAYRAAACQLREKNFSFCSKGSEANNNQDDTEWWKACEFHLPTSQHCPWTHFVDLLFLISGSLPLRRRRRKIFTPLFCYSRDGWIERRKKGRRKRKKGRGGWGKDGWSLLELVLTHLEAPVHGDNSFWFLSPLFVVRSIMDEAVALLKQRKII